jgi:hypothetical protein
LHAAGDALILIPAAVWDLPNTAWLNSCLLLLITAGAVPRSLPHAGAPAILAVSRRWLLAS